jgi:uncharacterized membrane protein
MADITGHSSKYIRPLHPPFTHFPVAAYVIAAGFDVFSVIGGSHSSWAGQLWHAGTFVLIAGLAICLVTMLTGFADLVRFGERRAAVVRTMAVHVCVQAGVFMIGVADVALRIAEYHRASTSPIALVLTIAAAIGVCTGAYVGGTLVYAHGHGVAVEAEPVRAPLRLVNAEAEPRAESGQAEGRAATGQTEGRAATDRAASARAARVRPPTRHRVHGG